MKVLVTGDAGLVGRSLSKLLINERFDVVRFDNCRQESSVNYGDILDFDALSSAASGCDGIVHLAGISRVIWGHQDPVRCWQNNVFGTKNVLKAALSAKQKPWVLFASSREVYGQQNKLPVSEKTAPLVPKNIYACSKLKAEELTFAARSDGLVTGVVRLSSVYGDNKDHKTRVVPAFALAALNHQKLCIEGRENACDFTHVSDVVAGIQAFIFELIKGRQLPAIHLTSGIGTSLIDLAKLAISKCRNSKAEICFSNPRHYDVSKFIGNPRLASELLGWKTRVSLSDGVGKLMESYSKESLIA